MKIERPVLLSKEHNVNDFDCGVEVLNRYLKNFALANQKNNSARTYVAISGNGIAGFYTISATSILHEKGTERLKKGLARHPIPMVLMGRLAVDIAFHGIGLGKNLLKDALLRSLEASEIIGARGILVHAKDEQAKAFYEKYNFEPLPDNEFYLVLLLKDLKSLLQ